MGADVGDNVCTGGTGEGVENAVEVGSGVAVGITVGVGAGMRVAAGAGVRVGVTAT